MSTPTPNIAEPTVTPTRYAVSCLPQDHPDARYLTVLVEHRRHDRWCVSDGFGYCYSLDGHRAYERLPSNREDDWRARYYFDLDTALALAKKIAPTMTSMALTVADALNSPSAEPDPAD